MFYPGYLEDLAAAIEWDRSGRGDRGDHGDRPAATPGEGSRGNAHGLASSTRAAVTAVVAMGALALLAPTTPADAAPSAMSGRAEVDAIGVVPCGITDLIARTPSAVDRTCLAEWWTWQHYLATLPRLP